MEAATERSDCFALTPPMSVSDFHGLAVPEGIDRRNLYMSSYRQITTYAMPVSELEAEFRRLVQKASASIKDANNDVDGAGDREA